MSRLEPIRCETTRFHHASRTRTGQIEQFKFSLTDKRPREETPILGEPRGPKTEMRMSPEETIKSVEGRRLKFARIVEVPPYHYGVVVQRVIT
jgi:hypothetical protein